MIDIKEQIFQKGFSTLFNVFGYFVSDAKEINFQR